MAKRERERERGAKEDREKEQQEREERVERRVVTPTIAACVAVSWVTSQDQCSLSGDFPAREVRKVTLGPWLFFLFLAN